MSATSQPSVVRRPQARKKVNDDASYFGPPGASSLKRQAVERVDGEPRMKRKRVEPVVRDPLDTESRISFVEFDKMPMAVIHRYLTHFDIIPPIYPSPLRADDPSPPVALTLPPHQPSRPDPKELPNRRRSSRLLEEDDIPRRVPILADVDELHSVLAGIAEKHFRETLSITGREEVDTLASFMCAVEKRKGGKATRW
ncbi:hypothetical protein EDD18DRAFT_1304894 [Armillaria luteobubalina]|uniref:Histone deacetylase complex subunit SAP30 Sin3 binding domain-containing protein n=1 Tax=Armillaria luteobubalina TaxID=153913 RepID=A0AA39UWQ8_9AGAR|nr:hypothetical protein EDD18DRAFT_1304894 [Armillaria luteobubalina]